MESSGEQALILGVNLFILIIALTCAIMLMVAVLNMSNAANTVIKTTTDTSLMTLYGGTSERVYTGEQLYAIISGYLSSTTDMKYMYDIYVKDEAKVEARVLLTSVVDGQTIFEKNTNLIFTKAMLDSTYSLKYYGKEEDGLERVIYKFEKITEQ